MSVATVGSRRSVRSVESDVGQSRPSVVDQTGPRVSRRIGVNRHIPIVTIFRFK